MKFVYMLSSPLEESTRSFKIFIGENCVFQMNVVYGSDTDKDLTERFGNPEY
jgi:hypothetical protein